MCLLSQGCPLLLRDPSMGRSIAKQARLTRGVSLGFQTTNLSPPDSGPALLVPPSSSEKVCPVQLVGHGWTSGSPQTQEAPCPEATWSWDQLPSRAPGKGFQWPESLTPSPESEVISCGFLWTLTHIP